MGWVLVGLGALVALIGYSGGLGISPQSAPQQAVQELRYLHGALGLVIMALGIVVVSRPRAHPLASSVPLPNGLSQQQPSQPPARGAQASEMSPDYGIAVGDDVENPRRGRGRVLELRGPEAFVDFGSGEPVQLSVAHLTRARAPEET